MDVDESTPTAQAPEAAPLEETASLEASSLALPPALVEATPAEQKAQIKALGNLKLVVGETWYIVSSDWLRRWRAYIGERTGTAYTLSIFNSSQASLHPGPIDNSSIFIHEEQTGKWSLRPYLTEGYQYELIHASVWDKLLSWYGIVPEQKPQPRQVIGPSYSPMVELAPFPLKICSSSNLQDVISIELSKDTSFASLKQQLCTRYNVANSTTSRIWSLLNGKPWEQHNHLEKVIRETYLQKNDTICLEIQAEDGSWPLTPKPSQSYSGSSSVSSVSATTGGSSWSYNSSWTSSISTPREKAPSGLGNLGNTCFMNSGLQCLVHSDALVKYFRNRTYKSDINESNPIGCGGKLAEAFAALLEKMSGSIGGSVSPYDIKAIISQFAPQFSGYLQHDSQELIAFLLDGLHEDLNRIQKKPYIAEDPEDEKLAPPDRAIKQWDNHKRRNDSVIVDLFHCQIKSTLVCPDCNKVSTTFDPQMYLAVPLPDREVKTVEVYVCWSDPQKLPTPYNITVPKRSGTIRQLSAQLSVASGLPTSEMLIVELIRSAVHKIFSPDDGVGAIYKNDVICAYQLTPSANPSDDLFVFLYHRYKKTVSYTYSSYYGNSSSYTYYYGAGTPRLVRLSKANLTLAAFQEAYQTAFSRVLTIPQESSDQDPLFTFSFINQAATTLLGDVTQDSLAAMADRSFIAIDWKDEATMQKYYDVTAEDNVADEADSNAKKPSSASSTITLEDCLNLFYSPETLSENNKWFCPVCKEFKQASKTTEIWSLPDILIVQLKRFSYNEFNRDKITALVDFPLTDLDLTNRVRGPHTEGKRFVYDLYAVSNHHGGYGGGHYTAHAYDSSFDKWFCFDDSWVTAADASAAKTASAYVLFYQLRKDDDPTQVASTTAAGTDAETA